MCNTRRDLEMGVLEGLASLVDKSLVQQVEQPDGEFRFAMLETIREYGLERLAASREDEATRRAHAAYFLVVAEDGNLPLTPPERTSWLELCDAEHDNLRAALDWLIARGNSEWAMRLAFGLYWFWEPREHLAEGRELVEAILKMRGGQARTKARARALTYAANLMANQGDYTASFPLSREALAIYHELGDTKSIAGQLNSLGINSCSYGDYAAARSWFEQSLGVCRELGDQRETAAALSNLAESVRAQSDPTLARSLFEEALSLFRELGDAVGVAWCFNHLGDVARDRGDLEEARHLYQEGADTFRRLGDRWGVARSLTDLGYLAYDQDDTTTARSLFEEAPENLPRPETQERGRKSAGRVCLPRCKSKQFRARPHAGWRSRGASAEDGAPARLDERAVLRPRPWSRRGSIGTAATSKTIWTRGWKMPLEQAIQYALGRRYSKPANSTQS